MRPLTCVSSARARRSTLLRRSAVLAVLAGFLLLSACGDAEAPTPEPTATSTPAQTATATATPTATPTGTPDPNAGDVRDVDFTDPSVIGPLIDHFGGGEVEPERVEYVDLTSDGVEEALVFVASGGTAGDLGGAIVGMRAGQPEVLYIIDVAGRIEVRFGDVGLGIVAVLEPIYADGDAACCPSQLQETVIQWDGSEFVVVSEQVIDNPDL